MQPRGTDMLVASVAVDTQSHVVPKVGATCGTEGLDGEDVAFFHALGGVGLDEGDLFVAVDLVAEDVVACEAADCADGNGFVVEGDFVAFHCFLDCGADVGDSGVGAGFLEDGLVLCTTCGVGQESLTFSPVLVAALTAASRLS